MTFKDLITDLRSINFLGGEISSLGDFLTSNKTELDREDFYTEDLIQVTYKFNKEVYFVDVGSYYNSNTEKSVFKILLIKNKEWETPLIEIKFVDYKLMKRSVEYAISCLDCYR